MLPDFPKLKSDFERRLNIVLRQKVRMSDPMLAMIGKKYQHEGDQSVYHTVEGKRKEMAYKKVESVFSLTREEVKNITPEQIIQKLDKIAGDISGHMARTLFSTIDQAVKEVGNVVDEKGKPFTFETFLKGIEKVQIDFDEETGLPRLPTFVAGPVLAEKVRAQIPEWEKNEDYNRRFKELIEKKRTEWNDRESHRKLVD